MRENHTAPLLSDDKLTVVEPQHLRAKIGKMLSRVKGNTILIRSGSVAIQSGLLAAHLAANSKMLSMLTNEESGAGSLTSTFQTVVLGSATGCLLSTGLEMGKPVGRGDFIEAGQIAKSSWVLTIGLGLVSMGAMGATKWIFPLMTSNPVAAEQASDFFLGYAVGGIPELLMMTTPQIAFQAGDWYVPALAGAIFYVPAAFISYGLAFPAGLGAFGIGLGGSVMAWLASFGVQLWVTRKNYEKFQLYRFDFGNLRHNLKLLVTTGVQLASQRLTEWGNVFAIITVLGAVSPNALAATNPTTQYVTIAALSMQGLAQAAAMSVLVNKGKQEKAIQDNNQTDAEHWHNQNRRVLLINNGLGIIVSASLAVSFYFARDPLSRFFLSTDTDPTVRNLAEEFLWISMVGTIADSMRIITLGALRSWKEVLRPTFECFLIMTILGVPIGYGAGVETGDWSYMFSIRDIMIAVASAAMALRCYNKLQNDAANLNLPNSGALSTASCSFFGNRRANYQSVNSPDSQPYVYQLCEQGGTENESNSLNR